MELWHVLNRGVEGRDLFLDPQDYARFVHNLYEFNDAQPADNLARLFDSSGMRDFVNPSFRGTRELLVEIHGWVLMRNHYHLLLSELVEGGISLFMRKLNTGYANYFNVRYARIGTLFQGRTKKVLIERQAHFLYILHYLHLNPLDYLKGAEGWRQRDKGRVPNIREALAHLDGYRWGSYLDYAGKKNFPSILTKNRFEDRSGEYVRNLRDYLRNAEEPGEDFANLWLE